MFENLFWMAIGAAVVHYFPEPAKAVFDRLERGVDMFIKRFLG